MRRFVALGIVWAGCALLGAGSCGRQDQTLHVGSKSFTESVLLAEIAAGSLRDRGFVVEHKAELGGSPVLFAALQQGDLDLYPEYTGTLRVELLSRLGLQSDAELPAALDGLGLAMTRPLGFNNSYALGVKRTLAVKLGLRRVSDLVEHPELRMRFSNEFMARADGWPGLQKAYRLPQEDVRGMEHALVYAALEAFELDVTDLYTTDAEIQRHDLVALLDDRGFFPRYDAVFLYRKQLQDRPGFREAVTRLEGSLDEASMVAQNARALIDREAPSEIARTWLESRFGIQSEVRATGSDLLKWILEHLFLVAVSLGLAIVISVPLGILAARHAGLRGPLLGGIGILQTIPSLALLVFMIPLLGLGAKPALAALFLYSLLPIVRNTCLGLLGIPPVLRESAEVLALSPKTRLLRVDLPMASPSILAGIKIAAVWNVGTATLGALIGAGGLGQPIWTGLRLGDTALILQGAIPAALLALAAQGFFDLLERWLVPSPLRSEHRPD